MGTCEDSVESICRTSEMVVVDDDVDDLADDGLGDRLGVLVVDSISSLDIGSKVESGGCSVSQSVSKEADCKLDHLEGENGDEVEPSSIPVADTNCEVVFDLKCDGEIENVASIGLGLSRICVDETQSKHVDFSHDGRVMPIVSAFTGGTDENNMGCTAGSENPSIQSPVEGDSNGTFDSAVDDVPSKSSIMPAEVKLNVGPVLVEASDHALKVGEDNTSTDNSVHVLKCPDLPSLFLPLRRSSRARKSFQKVQEEKPAKKCSKKASELTHGGTIDFLLNAIRKKRSFMSKSNKPLCPSGWGSSANLSKYFELSSKAGINAVSSKGLKKGKSSGKSRNQKASKVAVSSKSIEGEQQVAYRPIRLRVTFGKKDDKNNEARSLGIDALCNLSLGNDSHHPDLSSYIGSTEKNVMNDSSIKEMATLKRCSDSVTHVRFPGTDLESSSMLEKPTHTGSVPFEADKLSSSHVDKYVDPGTSPDSEVIDQILDSTTGVSASNPGNGSYKLPAKKSKKKRNKKDKVPQAVNPDVEDKLLCRISSTKAKVLKKAGKQKGKNGTCAVDVGITAPIENPSSHTCGSELISSEGPHNGLDNGADSNIYSSVGFGVESVDSGNSCQLLPLDQSCGDKSVNCSNSTGRSRNKSIVADASRKKTDPTWRKKKDPSGQLEADKRKLIGNCVINMDGISCEAYSESHQPETVVAEKFVTFDVEKTDMGNELAPENQSCQTVVSNEVAELMLPPRIAWVCCDDCNKWRCVPAELADAIEATNSRWTCMDNQDETFADCSIPQEKSNSDINAELQISDEEESRGGYLGSKGSQSSTWMRISSNLYLHRSRKTQTVDEIMVCHCKPSAEGCLGCGSQCLNRMLNIECVQGTCPCGDLCSNQRFQRQQYAKLSWFRCGKKGYGLQVLKDISKGQFLIEYVGEVLDLQAYESRQKEYASQGHKHFYFMTLNGNEVIDACVKGNLGRFVNHSCDPNCRTEKWVVNGEICVGLFALRNIRKGEELTFDYNYVRVFGAAAKKCHCGSERCRGYIGGDPRDAEVIVHGDSDDEFPEPIAVDENGEIDHSIKNMMDRMKLGDNELGQSADNLCEEHVKGTLESGEMTNEMEKSPIGDGGLSPALAEKGAFYETRASSDSLASSQVEDLNAGAQFATNPPASTTKQISTIEQTIGTPTSSPVQSVLLMKRMVKDSLTGSVDCSGKMSERDNVERERPPSKSRPRMKISRPFKSLKHRKPNSNSVKGPAITQRFQVLSCRPKKLFEGSANCNLEAVEEKLNELLDINGGICKRKDSSKGYLKLLLLTAASGDSCNGGAIQSNRDLSMILDAILKTKSRGVLLDIINKNGLQMLHNMMKLYRKDFNKIPILRKLLKVFEFLAEKEILTIERINGDPVHPGVESFQESILSFTEHNDKKVHQIARNFRDTWIPRSMRKVNRRVNTGRNREVDRGAEYFTSFETHHHWRDHDVRPTEPMGYNDQLVISQNSTDTTLQEVSCPKICDSQPIVTLHRKRKSRWDQPADPVSPRQRKEQRILPNSPQIITSPKSEIGRGFEICVKVDDVEKTEDAAPGVSSPLPPGFSLQGSKDVPPGCSSCSPSHCATHIKSSSVACIGHFQERFSSHLPVAYGIPFSFVQQLGTFHSESDDSWVIAPAMPFQPFPPLPPYPRIGRDFLQPCAVNIVTLNGGLDRDFPQPCAVNDVPLNGGVRPERDFPQPCTGNNVTLTGGPRDFPQLSTGNNVTFNGGPERDFPQSCTGNNVTFNGGPERDFPQLSGNNVTLNGGPERELPQLCTSNNVTFNGGSERDFPQLCTGNNMTFDGGLERDFPQLCTGNNNNMTFDGGPDWDFPQSNVNFDRDLEEMRMDNRFHGNSYWDQDIPSTSSTTNQHMLPQERGFSNNFGRRFNRQRNNHHPRKRNNHHLDCRVPWVRKRFRWGFKGNHPRNGAFIDKIANEQNVYRFSDVNHSVDCAGNSC